MIDLSTELVPGPPIDLSHRLNDTHASQHGAVIFTLEWKPPTGDRDNGTDQHQRLVIRKPMQTNEDKISVFEVIVR